jgi:hypothetical protein
VLLAYPFALGSVLFGEPGGPAQEGNDMAFRPLHDRVVVRQNRALPFRKRRPASLKQVSVNTSITKATAERLPRTF